MDVQELYKPQESFYDEVDILSFKYNKDLGIYTYPCPCGDEFVIYREDLENGEEVATCPSCSLIVRVIYEIEDL